MKYIILIFSIALIGYLVWEYQRFVRVEDYLSEIYKVSDEFYGGARMKDVVAYRSKIVDEVNSQFEVEISSFEEIESLSDEQWRILVSESHVKKNAVFSELFVSTNFASQVIKDKYYLNLEYDNSWIDQDNFAESLEDHENYIADKESRSNSTLVRFMKYVFVE